MRDASDFCSTAGTDAQPTKVDIKAVVDTLNAEVRQPSKVIDESLVIFKRDMVLARCCERSII